MTDAEKEFNLQGTEDLTNASATTGLLYGSYEKAADIIKEKAMLCKWYCAGETYQIYI